jgi:hypothetical protein
LASPGSILNALLGAANGVAEHVAEHGWTIPWDLHLPLVATHISLWSHNAVQINKDLANASLAQVLVEHACRILGHVLFLAAYDNASVR